MRAQASEQDISQVCRKIESLGLRPHIIPGAQRTAIGITGNRGNLDPAEFEDLPGVAEAIPVSKPYKLVSREVKPEDTVVEVAGTRIGGPELVLCAGPCAVENREQILAAARAVARPARNCCAAAPTSRAPRPTPSRASARRA